MTETVIKCKSERETDLQRLTYLGYFEKTETLVTAGFLIFSIFSGGTEVEHWLKMG